MDRYWRSGRIPPSHTRIWLVSISASTRETAREEFVDLFIEFVETVTKSFLATFERSPALYKLAPAAPTTRAALQNNQ